nr:hypothetical protein [uncultured Flavobacterium sp.]
MKFDIYHAIKGNFFADKLPAESYKKVASVNVSSLEDAYAKSQNIESTWTEHPDVITNLTECRSTSVGDIIYNTEESQGYMVMNIGFEKVDVFK